MPQYTIKNALVDLGFIDGYVTENATKNFQLLREALDRLDSALVEHGTDSTANPFILCRRVIHDLGYLRGLLWNVPLHDAYSDAMDRLMEYFVEGGVEWYKLPYPYRCTPDDLLVTDEQRDSVNSAYIEGPGVAAEETGLPLEVVERIVHPRTKAAMPPLDAPTPEPPVSPPVPACDSPTDSAPEPPVPEHESPAGEREGSNGQSEGEIVERIRELAAQGWTDKMIVGEVGFSVPRICVIRKANGILPGSKQRKAAGEPLVQEEADDPPAVEPPETAEPEQPEPSWDFQPLDPEDWPDIQRMLAGSRTREGIASDYDVPVEHLNAFIEERLREGRERRASGGGLPPPGEAAAPLAG